MTWTRMTYYQKYYTMGPSCGALLYNEDGNSKFMFYDGNFSNVAGIDIFGNDLYSKEYGPNGEILYSIDYSNIAFGCNLYDEDLSSYFEKATGASSAFGSLSYSISKDLPTFKKISIIARATAKSSGPPTDWIWIWLEAQTVNCYWINGEIDCFFDNEIDGGSGGSGDGYMGDCLHPRSFDDCILHCSSPAKCKSCCLKMYNKCMLPAKKPCFWVGIAGFMMGEFHMQEVCLAMVSYFFCWHLYESCVLSCG